MKFKKLTSLLLSVLTAVTFVTANTPAVSAYSATQATVAAVAAKTTTTSTKTVKHTAKTWLDLSYPTIKRSHKHVLAYGFTKKLTVGLAPDKNNMPIETDWSNVTAEVIDKNHIKTTIFRNSRDSSEQIGYNLIGIQSLNNDYSESIKPKSLTKTWDLSKFRKKGVNYAAFAIDAYVVSDKSHVNLNFGIDLTDNNNIKLFYIKTSDHKFTSVINRRAKVDKLLKNVDPKKQTDVSKVVFKGSDKWIKFSKNLINSKMSDELKVFTAFRWINENFAYDKWYRDQSVNNVPNRKRRYDLYPNVNDTFDTKTGTCAEQALIFIIMCRTWNIPCINLSNNCTHEWAAVYLNNRWIEIDFIETNSYKVYDKALDAKWVYDDPDYYECLVYDTDLATPIVVNVADVVGYIKN